jgi:hypothetical protein
MFRLITHGWIKSESQGRSSQVHTIARAPLPVFLRDEVHAMAVVLSDDRPLDNLRDGKGDLAVRAHGFAAPFPRYWPSRPNSEDACSAEL